MRPVTVLSCKNEQMCPRAVALLQYRANVSPFRRVPKEGTLSRLVPLRPFSAAKAASTDLRKHPSSLRIFVPISTQKGQPKKATLFAYCAMLLFFA